MKIKLIICIIFSFCCVALKAQQNEEKEKIQLYSPEKDAHKDLTEAIANAKQHSKHVLIQVGGNWCPWCIKLHNFINENAVIDSIIKADYILLKINYSKENRNLDVMKILEYPQRFGFPVLLVLDAGGKRLHTQDTGFLELDGGYDLKKLKTFLLAWNRGALLPENYISK